MVIGGGSGGAAGGGTSLVSWNVVPGSTGVKCVEPTRSGGRTASRREARNAGDGSAARNTATASGSFGRPVNPAGSITNASGGNAAQVVLALRNCCGAALGDQFSPGASGPQPARRRAYSQKTSPGLNTAFGVGDQTQPMSPLRIQRP